MEKICRKFQIDIVKMSPKIEKISFVMNRFKIFCIICFNSMLQTAQAGLNFASEDEAAKFKTSVEQKLLERHKRRMGKVTGRGTCIA